MKRNIVLVSLIGGLAFSCVSKKQYEEALSNATKLQEEVANQKQKIESIQNDLKLSKEQNSNLIDQTAEYKFEYEKLKGQTERDASVLQSYQNQVKQQNSPNYQVNMENKIEKVSYGLGINIADNLTQQGFSELNTDALVKGFLAKYKGEETEISSQEAQTAIQSYFSELQKEKEKLNAIHGEANKIKGEQFLAENKSKEGVKVTASGLQYKVLKEGTGDKPAATNTVRVHYHGTLIDGTVFDSSVERGNPAEFPLNRVIPGWTEGVQLMSVGSKYRFFIPYQLAYGERDAGTIKPFSALIFDVELLEIK